MPAPIGNPAWKKGVSGNPSGRPKSKPISDELRKIGEAGGYQQLAAKLFIKALEGDVRSAQEILNRIEGRVTDRLVIDSGGVDLMELLRRKADGNAQNAERADDSELYDEPGDA